MEDSEDEEESTAKFVGAGANTGKEKHQCLYYLLAVETTVMHKQLASFPGSSLLSWE